VIVDGDVPDAAIKHGIDVRVLAADREAVARGVPVDHAVDVHFVVEGAVHVHANRFAVVRRDELVEVMRRRVTDRSRSGIKLACDTLVAQQPVELR
jgi:hypothetical protein